jgi:hypothetical protein
MATNGIKNNQRRALRALLEEPTIKAAADAAKVGERTLHRWLKEDAAFLVALRESQDAAVALAVARLANEMPASIETLAAIRDDAEVNASARVTAARVILAESRQAREFYELLDRMQKLEEVTYAKR